MNDDLVNESAERHPDLGDHSRYFARMEWFQVSVCIRNAFWSQDILKDPLTKLSQHIYLVNARSASFAMMINVGQRSINNFLKPVARRAIIMFGIEKHYCNVSVMCNILMCSNLHCIIDSNVTETNCGTQALIVAANDGVCFIPDHMQHFSLDFRPQLRSGIDSVIRITCCNLHSSHHSDFLTLSRP